MSHNLTPLRTTVGRPLRIQKLEVSARSAAVEEAHMEVRLQLRERMAEVAGENYADYLPRRIDLTSASSFEMFDGVASLPPPTDFPFDIGQRGELASLQGLFPQASSVSSRALWIEVIISLESEELVGGICYAGYPFLPYYITEQGENSSNFGLPREIRLSWQGRGTEFLDDVSTVARQEAASHSGVHYLCTGPVRTKSLILTLSDFPKFIKGYQEGGAPVERFGFLLPAFSVFRYEEGSRYKVHVPAGLLGATKVPPSSAASTDSYPRAVGRGRPAADFIYYAQSPGRRYLPLSAASLFGQRRRYTTGLSGVPPFEECFYSPLLAPDHQIMLYIEQGEEHPRCAAGFKLELCSAWLEGLLERSELELKIYEIDPPPGVPPLQVTDPEEDKYATCLYEDWILPDSPAALTCKFVKPSASRYFILVFTNFGRNAAKCQFGLRSVELIQSAHVYVVPRAARTLQVQRMHYRLVGENLATDYSVLGAEGFSFAVERLVAGEMKDVLFSADSLLGLLETGTARLYANHRYEETLVDVSREDVQTEEGSYDVHSTQAWAEGWRRNETGKDVRWDRAIRSGEDPNAGLGFRSFGNAETRVHTEVIGHEGLPEFFDTLREVVNLLAANNPIFSDNNFWPDPTRGRKLVRQDVWDAGGLNWKEVIWKGIDVDHMERVGLMTSLSVPPMFASPKAMLSFLQTAAEKFVEWSRNPGAFPDGPPLDDLAQLLYGIAGANVGPLNAQLLNGLGIGFSLGASFYVGGSYSFSCAPVLPTLSHSTTSGVTGNIVKQASNTGYSYNQSLNKGFDATEVRTDYAGGKLLRTVRRTADKQQTEKARTRGAEIMWQGRLVDIVTGTIPIGMSLPATAGQMYRTSDESLRVRFGGGLGDGLQMDVWFDVQEEVIRDDY